MSPFARLCLPVLLAAPLALALAQPAAAQARAGESAFDYSPGAEAPAERAGRQPPVNLADVEVIKYPQGTTAFIYKHRWKDWLERTVYLCLVAVALLALTASLGLADEQNLLIAYVLEGVNFMMAQWVLVCGITLLKMRSPYGFYALPAGLALGAATYYLLMKIRAADVSLAEVRDAFLQPAEGSGSDQRLASVDGSPGDWPDKDIDR